MVTLSAGRQWTLQVLLAVCTRILIRTQHQRQKWFPFCGEYPSKKTSHTSTRRTLYRAGFYIEQDSCTFFSKWCYLFFKQRFFNYLSFIPSLFCCAHSHFRMQMDSHIQRALFQNASRTWSLVCCVDKSTKITERFLIFNSYFKFFWLPQETLIMILDMFLVIWIAWSSKDLKISRFKPCNLKCCTSVIKNWKPKRKMFVKTVL